MPFTAASWFCSFCVAKSPGRPCFTAPGASCAAAPFNSRRSTVFTVRGWDHGMLLSTRNPLLTSIPNRILARPGTFKT